MNHRKIKNHPLELISRPEATTASQENDAAKIQNKIEIARNNLKKVAEIYEGADASTGFITNLKMALGIMPYHASDYAIFRVGDPPVDVSIRISNHNANAANYNVHKVADFNISIVIKGRRRTTNTFVMDNNVTLYEYVYLEKDLKKVENPFSKIAGSLAQFLLDGVYKDTTGVARVNVSRRIV